MCRHPEIFFGGLVLVWRLSGKPSLRSLSFSKLELLVMFLLSLIYRSKQSQKGFENGNLGFAAAWQVLMAVGSPSLTGPAPQQASSEEDRDGVKKDVETGKAGG